MILNFISLCSFLVLQLFFIAWHLKKAQQIPFTVQNFFQRDFIEYKLTSSTKKRRVPVRVSTAEHIASAAQACACNHG